MADIDVQLLAQLRTWNPWWQQGRVVFYSALVFLVMFLVKIGFLKRTNKGRVITKAAYEHLGIKFAEENKTQQKLL